MTSVPPPGYTAIAVVNSDGGRAIVTVVSRSLLWQTPAETNRMIQRLVNKASLSARIGEEVR